MNVVTLFLILVIVVSKTCLATDEGGNDDGSPKKFVFESVEAKKKWEDDLVADLKKKFERRSEIAKKDIINYDEPANIEKVTLPPEDQKLFDSVPVEGRQEWLMSYYNAKLKKKDETLDEKDEELEKKDEELEKKKFELEEERENNKFSKFVCAMTLISLTMESIEKWAMATPKDLRTHVPYQDWKNGTTYLNNKMQHSRTYQEELGKWLFKLIYNSFTYGQSSQANNLKLKINASPWETWQFAAVASTFKLLRNDYQHFNGSRALSIYRSLLNVEPRKPFYDVLIVYNHWTLEEEDMSIINIILKEMNLPPVPYDIITQKGRKNIAIPSQDLLKISCI